MLSSTGQGRETYFATCHALVDVQLGTVLGERGEERGIPLSDLADALEAVLVKLCGEPGVSGVERRLGISNGAGLF